MIIPVRCFACGKPIAQVWEEFKEKVAAGEDKSKAMDELGIDKMCCRSVFLGQEDLIELVGKFKKA